jgi:hypothetical protein
MARTPGYKLTARVFLVAFSSTLAAIAEAEPMTTSRVIVRIWDRAGLGSEVWNHAKAVAEKAFKPAQIELAWLDCVADDQPEHMACASPTGNNDICLRIYQRTKADFQIRGRARGGTSLLLSPEGGKGLVHIFVDRLREVSQSHKVPLELVLGITIAHEAGHLLLPHQPHTLAGIMRGELDSKDWLLAAQGSLGFTEGQRHVISSGVETRALKGVALSSPSSRAALQDDTEVSPETQAPVRPPVLPSRHSIADRT